MTDRMDRRDNAYEAGRLWAIKASWTDIEELVLDQPSAAFPDGYTAEEKAAFHRGAKAIYDKVNQATERKPHGNFKGPRIQWRDTDRA
jgi:hypothetical protein